MSFLACRAPAWRFNAVAVGLVLAAATVLPARADDNEGVALELGEAASLAVTAQPLLTGLEARARAARESAVAAGQLPDPQLFTAIADLPVNTSDAYSLHRDSDTQIQVVVSQEFPRAEKRRLRGEVSEREGQRLDAEHHVALRSIRRDASLAWIELWRYDQALRLVRATLREAETQTEVVEIALRTGTATQAEYLAARQEADRLRDEVAGTEQSIGHARNTLSRWIGDAAWRPVCPDLPQMDLPPLVAVLERVQSHPNLADATAQIAAAETNADLAKAGYKPDWRVQVGYGYRPSFSEMVTLQVGMDLPVFTHNRQDREVSAALARKEASESALEDERRQLASEARLNHHDWQRLTLRLKDYDTTLLPQSENRVTASLAGWRSGRGMLRDVLEARRAALELQMTRLELQRDLAMHTVQLTYLGAFETTSNAGENTHE